MANITFNKKCLSGSPEKIISDPWLKIFSKPQKVSKALEKIWRYHILYESFETPLASLRKRKIEQHKAIWETALDGLKKSDNISSTFEALAKLGDKIANLYIPALKRTNDTGGLLMKFQKDTQRIPADPFKKSNSGTKGPTCLISYPTEKGMRSFVIKYLDDQIEPIANRLYRGFSKFFSKEDISLGFSVPLTSSFDFQSGIYDTPECFKPISPEEREDLQGRLLQIAKAMESSPVANHVMISERVPGQNLLHFIMGGYPTLTEDQRAKFFERLGRIALLDLVMGNVDRFIRIINEKDGSYNLDNQSECNLGNLMVEYSQEKKYFRFHAIDNELVLDKSLAAYEDFLDRIFSCKDPFTPLIENISICFENALNAQSDEIDLRDFQKQNEKISLANLLKPIKDDLKKIAEKNLRLGMAQMCNWLKGDLFEAWQKDPLKNYLRESSPQLLQAVEERFKAFRTREIK